MTNKKKNSAQPSAADQAPGAENVPPEAECRPQTEAELALAAQLEKAEAEREEYLNLAQRVQADFDNYRRRNQQVRAEAIADGAAEVLTQLLPVLDNMERAVDAAQKAGEDASVDQTAAMRAGVELVLRQLREALGKFGVEEISRVGEAFDPEMENAVMQGTAEEGEPGTVSEVFQKGYKTPGKVLRYAMVKVVPS